MYFYPTGLVLVGIFSLKRVRNIDFFKERCHNQVNSKKYYGASRRNLVC